MLRRLDIRGFRVLESFSMSFSPTTCIIGPPSSGKSALVDAIRMIFHPGRGAGSLRLTEWDFSRTDEPELEELTFDMKALLGPIDAVDPDAPTELLDLLEYFDPDDLEPMYSPTSDSLRMLRLGLRARWNPSEGTFSYEHYSPKLSKGEDLRLVHARTREWLAVNVIRAGRTYWSEMAPHSQSALHQLFQSSKADMPSASRAVADALAGVGADLSKRPGFLEGLASLDSRIAATTRNELLGLQLGAGLPLRTGSLSRLSLVTESGSPLELEGSATTSAAILSSLLEVGGVGVVVVDAPEASLPPPLQRNLIARLVNEAQQTIVVTHSPPIVSLFDPEEITVLRGKEKPLILRDELAKVSSAGQVRRFWRARPDFMAALSGRWALVVEGESDRVVYGRVLERLSHTNEDAGIILSMWMIDGGGTDAIHLLDFLEGCGVRTCALVDGDKEGRELQEFERAATCLVQLPNGMDLEDLLASCTDDPVLTSRIESLRGQKGDTVEYVEVTTEILDADDIGPLSNLLSELVQVLRSAQR